MTSSECNIINFTDDDGIFMDIPLSSNIIVIDSDDDVNDIMLTLPNNDVIELDSDTNALGTLC